MLPFREITLEDKPMVEHCVTENLHADCVQS